MDLVSSLVLLVLHLFNAFNITESALHFLAHSLFARLPSEPRRRQVVGNVNTIGAPRGGTHIDIDFGMCAEQQNMQ